MLGYLTGTEHLRVMEIHHKSDSGESYPEVQKEWVVPVIVGSQVAIATTKCKVRKIGQAKNTEVWERAPYT